MRARAEAAASPPRPGKRERLIAAGRLCLHRQGVCATTIADIAREADVPAGNVHYYFKTRDEIVEAVIEAQNEATRERLRRHERRRTPAARLKALMTEIAGYSEEIVRYGCPIGTLCSELDKTDGDLSRHAAISLQLMVDWAEQQFRLMGRTRDARALALELIGRYEGAALLTNSMRDPSIMREHGRRINRWIDAIASGQTAS